MRGRAHDIAYFASPIATAAYPSSGMLVRMSRLLITLILSSSLCAAAQTPTPTNPLAPLDFLTGPWIAATNASGQSSGNVLGTYTFTRTLAGHALERTGTVATCKGPQDFDCNHHDSLTIFPEAAALAALYLDNEGNVIHYTITLSAPHTAIFLSQGPPPPHTSASPTTAKARAPKPS